MSKDERMAEMKSMSKQEKKSVLNTMSERERKVSNPPLGPNWNVNCRF